MKKGFTLLELMIVVTIIGVILGIIFPRMIGFIDKGREGAIKGNLGSLRTAIALYHNDHLAYPSSTITTQLVPEYLPSGIPFANLRQQEYGHSDSTNTISSSDYGIRDGAPGSVTVWLTGGAHRGGWYYFPESGVIRVNCTHNDSYGNPYWRIGDEE